MHPKTVELQARTQKFAASVIALCERLPHAIGAQRIAGQLIDSAGGTDCNYRGACRARSKAEFIAKLGVVIEEADESKGWLELLVASSYVPPETAAALIQEADELLSIFVKSKKTAESRKEEQERFARESRRQRSR